MALRTLTALVLIPPVVYIIGWAPEWLFLLVLIAAVERSLYEYFVISRQAGFKSLSAVGYVAARAARNCMGARHPRKRSRARWEVSSGACSSLGASPDGFGRQRT